MSEASSLDISCSDGVDTNVLSASDSLMSGVTTVSSKGSNDSNCVNEKLKFATTEEVHQFRVPEGSPQKRVMDPAKKRRKKEELTKKLTTHKTTLTHAQTHNKKQCSQNYSMDSPKRRKRKVLHQVLLSRGQNYPR